MIRCPEAWRLDFQPKLKWATIVMVWNFRLCWMCIDTSRSTQKIYDYALAYADTRLQ